MTPGLEDYHRSPGTTYTVVRTDGTTKQMSRAQLEANLEPGDTITYQIHGGRTIRKGTILQVEDGLFVKDGHSALPLSYDEIIAARLRHPERDP